MKHISRVIIAVFLAIIMGTTLPLSVFADTPTYIKEVKIGMDREVSQATDTLDGYHILSDSDGDPINLNERAETNDYNNSRGKMAVLLGYKTTKNRKEAITDLALMNMKGGYSVMEYELLMETQLKTQIIPFVERFQAAIDEYRENYKSGYKGNSARARYIHDVLNKLTDDDTGKPLGDLLLNETKYEMGDSAYNALSDEEKKNHADILTIIAQSNGRATLAMESLITRAADTEDSTWLDRFEVTTYDDLIKQTGLSPKEARKKVAKEYDDLANDILEKWDNFREELLFYDKAKKTVSAFDENAVKETIEKVNTIDENTSEDEAKTIIDAAEKANEALVDYAKSKEVVVIYDKLQSIPYLDSTMLDFFEQESSVVEDDITLLYPMAASLSDGQMAGVDFLSLREFMMVAIDNERGYSDHGFDSFKPASIYEGVDRGIYQKGGVAITSDALRKEAAENYYRPDEDTNVFSVYLYITLGFVSAGVVSGITAVCLHLRAFNAEHTLAHLTEANFMRAYANAWKATRIAYAISLGFVLVSIVTGIITAYLNEKELQRMYHVEFTPIPHYMIDEKDLVGYNSKGEKVVLKNQSAYYNAVKCTRNSDFEMWDELGDCADMNGDVGVQWLALYAAKNENEEPILAGSLKVVIGSDKAPSDYETGIHMFGSGSAFNLNNPLYCWNEDAKSIYVYYKTGFSTDYENNIDEETDIAGANFTAGTLALTGGAGIVFGAVVTALVMKSKRKREDNKAVTV